MQIIAIDTWKQYPYSMIKYRIFNDITKSFNCGLKCQAFNFDTDIPNSISQQDE